MKRMNIIVVYDKDIKNVLMCKRVKEPYKDKYNFVGGKIENDDNLNEAYRELREETGIKNKDIDLKYFMNIKYVVWDMELEVYYGVLKNDVLLVEEINKLEWVSLKENFFDLKKFAGDGNIGHILEEIKYQLR